MKPRSRYVPRICLVVLAALVLSSAVFPETRITLKKSFVEKYKNRATISVDFEIDHAKAGPNSISAGGKDGDLHISGRSTPVGLPLVVEIMNAKEQPGAVADAKAKQGETVPVSGAWRLWMEHGGGVDQIQGSAVQPAEDTNPDHVFQIHPLTSFDGHNLTTTFSPIPGYTAYPAQDAFLHYERVRSVISQKSSTITIATSMAGYNYVEFVLEANGPPQEVADGYFVMATVRESGDSDEMVVRNRRMVFAKGTPPAERAQALTKGDRVHVLGVPRVDLALVSWRAAHGAEQPEVLRWSLPYEIVVVALLPD